MADITLIQAPPWGVSTPPLGIAYLSSYLKDKGVDARIFDINIALYNMASDKGLWSFERKDEWSDIGFFRKITEGLDKYIASCVERILSDDPLAVGISVNQNGALFSLELARRLKEEDEELLIIAGGWGCYNEHERKVLRQGALIDAFVIGEGEETLYEIIAAIKKRGKIRYVKGMLRKEEDDSALFLRKFIGNLDRIPFPTYEEFRLQDYEKPILCMLSTRGCIGACAFCNDRVYQGGIRYRSPEKIVREIDYHMRENNISDFSFNDLLINADPGRLSSWCELIIKNKLKIRWVAQFLARRDTDLKLLSRMKEAGCQALQFGIESGSERVLKRMRKMFTVADAQRTLELSRKAGIQNWINLIVGFPGEKEEDILETIRFMERNRGNIDKVGSVNMCNVVFNSDLMKRKDDFGIILSDNYELIEMSWHTSDGNCGELRKQRAKRLVALLKDMDLPLGQDNLFLFPQ